jgi:hypothetical protein
MNIKLIIYSQILRLGFACIGFWNDHTSNKYSKYSINMEVAKNIFEGLE